MQKRKECNDTSKHYVDKEELRLEVISCKKSGVVSDNLANMFIQIVNGVAHRFSNLQYYGVIEDAKQDCLELLLKKYNNFDPEKESIDEKTGKLKKASSFAFFTTIVYRHMQYQTTRAKRMKERTDDLNQKVIDFLEEREGRL